MQNIHQVFDGSILKKRREELGLTQEQVAEYVCVSTSTVGNWEINRRNPRFSTLQKLVELYGLKLPGWKKATTKVDGDDLVRKKGLLKQKYDIELV